ncbi:ComF family protein [Croceibacterium sp. TMG7-5b_MA50]|uniref:ComF family protein n=1 Tax=Croceibacterium sp. TMG7-5b_MA50 TaxID=3121290 RepID=UPI0032215839
MRAALASGLAPLADLVFPPRCPACGLALAAQAGLCGTCWQDVQRPETSDDGVVAATLYGPISRKLVLAFKHGGRVTLAPLLGRMIAARLPTLEGEWLIVPVPLHRRRLWRRGYNQSALLAREVARITGHALAVDALLRRRPTRSLGGLGRAERARVLAGAIVSHPRAGALLAGRRIILVDDVLTSGATSEACRTALLQAGAREVLVACFARVID